MSGQRKEVTDGEERTYCISCGVETFVEEYGNPKDADICGYCFADRLNEIRDREGYNVPKPEPQWLIDQIQATCEIKLEASEDSEESEAYERIIRIIES